MYVGMDSLANTALITLRRSFILRNNPCWRAPLLDEKRACVISHRTNHNPRQKHVWVLSTLQTATSGTSCLRSTPINDAFLCMHHMHTMTADVLHWVSNACTAYSNLKVSSPFAFTGGTQVLTNTGTIHSTQPTSNQGIKNYR